MKRTFVASCIALLLTAMSASAESITVTDGTANVYGNARGVAVDFDSTAAPNADWSPDLVAGQTYTLNSLSLRDANATAGAVYLGVYTGYVSGALSGFLGASTNSVDFSTNTDGTFAQFNFTGINVTVDSTASTGTAAAPAGGSGMLFFAFQGDQSAQASVGTIRAIHRIDGTANATVGSYLATILDTANPGAFNTRAPEYQASLTLVPEPGAIAMLGMSALALLATPRRRART